MPSLFVNSRLILAGALALAVPATSSVGPRLSPESLAAWTTYIEAVEARGA
jgi:hypothetical protein